MSALVASLAVLAVIGSLHLLNVLAGREIARRARLRQAAISRHPVGKALRREDQL